MSCKRFARALGQRGRQMQRVAAELTNRDLERRSRSQRRLLEEQRNVQPGKADADGACRPSSPIGLHLRRDAQQALEVDAREVEDRQEVLGEPSRRRAIHYVRYSPLIRTYSALRSQVQIVAD